MWAMMVHALGALSISALGGLCMKRRQRSFIETWIQRFIERNPRLALKLVAGASLLLNLVLLFLLSRQ